MDEAEKAVVRKDELAIVLLSWSCCDELTMNREADPDQVGFAVKFPSEKLSFVWAGDTLDRKSKVNMNPTFFIYVLSKRLFL